MKRPILQVLGLAAAFAVLTVGCRVQEQVSAPSELFDIELTMSTNRVFVGDPVEAHLQVLHPEGSSFQVQPPAHEAIVQVIDRADSTTTLADSNKLTGLRFKFVSFEPGIHPLFTGTVVFTLSDGSAITNLLPLTELEVASVLTNEQPEMAGNTGNVQWPGTAGRYLTALVVVLLLAVAAALLAAWLIPRKKKEVIQPPPPPPHETALIALTGLRNKQYIEKLLFEPFYVELSRIVRVYLEGRFDLRAPELTTEEFIREAASSRALSAEHKDLTNRFLIQCDLVKFARHEPGQAEMETAFSAAEKLVKDTIPQESPGEDGKEDTSP